MIKRPSFQFYPADWRKDPALSACSLSARGLWIELCCIAHESDEYGVLSINGKPMSDIQLARMVGESPKAVIKLIAELEQAGVFSRLENGAIYSRRMVKDEHIRNVRASAGSKGGNPDLIGKKVKQNQECLDKQNGEQILTPSSSSSSSTSINTPHTPKPASDGFERFWSAYPKKVGKVAAEKAWQKAKINGHTDDVIAAVEAQKQSEQWRKERGQFIPNPATWITQGRWLDELGVGSSSDADNSLFQGML